MFTDMALDLEPGFPVRRKTIVPGVTGFGAAAEITSRGEWKPCKFVKWQDGCPVICDEDGSLHMLHSRDQLEY